MWWWWWWWWCYPPILETFELHPLIRFTCQDSLHKLLSLNGFLHCWGGWFGSCTSECVHLREGHPDSIDGSTFIPNLVKNRIEFDEFLKVFLFLFL
jgi:hypothetical protein